MKKTLTIGLLTLLLAVNISFAQSNEAVRNRIKEKLKSFTTEDFQANTKNLYQRVPNQQLNDYYKANPSLRSKKSQNQALSGQEKMAMPKNLRIPGEFEELQAVLITWPYYSFDKNEVIQSFLDQLFAGKAFYFNQNTGQGGLIDIVSVPDVFEDSEFGPLFAGLADAIQQEVPVWINIWQGEDSTDIKNYMLSQGKPLTNYKFFINQGNSFWYRDCGPVAFYDENDELGFIDFEYYGGRPLDDDIPYQVGNEMGIPVYTSTIEYEGGNILLDGDGSLFTSTAVSYLNGDRDGKYFLDTTSPYGFSIQEKDSIGIESLKDSLINIMNLKNIHIMPELQNDGGTGHIDLYADFFDENTFVFSRMPQELASFADSKIVGKNIDTMLSLNTRNGRKFMSREIPFPRKDNSSWYSSRKDYARYTRTYSNHIMVNKTIIQPVFFNDASGDRANNEIAIENLKAAYPGYKIAPIDVRSFDGFGGAIHCITKQIPAENPLTIFHYPCQLSDRIAGGFPITAEILNKSGIASAKVMYRLKGTENWNEASLTNDGNNMFSGNIPDANIADTDVVEYYVLATSNNGKTISKPITAPEGFYTINLLLSGVEENIFQETGEFFPNPANEMSSIELNLNGNSNLKIEIIDMSGNSVYRNSITVNSGYDVLTINTSNLSTGSYLVNIITEDGKSLNKKLNVVR